jgi:uncharacterized protein
VNFLLALLVVALLIVTVFALWLAVVNAGASRLMRRRRPDPPDPPSNYGLDYEEVQFPSRDHIRLVGWWIPAEQSIGTIVVCHGQNGSMDGDTRQIAPLHAAGFNVLMFDFRAHGRSGGNSVTMGMYEKEDLLGALDYLGDGRGIIRVGVLGFSMGAAVALITAALSDRIGALVVDGSFGRLKYTLSAYATQHGIPGFLARWLAGGVLATASLRTEGRLDQADPIRWTVHIGPRPILFIHGDKDPFVRMSDVDRMAGLASGPTEIWAVSNVGHRGAYKVNPEVYNQRVTDWFCKYLTEPVAQSTETAMA